MRVIARRPAAGPTAAALALLLTASTAAAAPAPTAVSAPEPAPAAEPSAESPSAAPTTPAPASPDQATAPVPVPAVPAEAVQPEPPPVTLPFVSPTGGGAPGPEAAVSESDAGRASIADAVPARPRFDVSVRVGPSFEAGTAVPAFAVGAGIGDGALGFVAELCSTQASGRFHGASAGRSIDRLAFDALLAVRLFAIAAGGSRERTQTWPLRIARAFTLLAGAGRESDSVGQESITRLGLVFGAQLDLPLTPASMTSEVRLRFGVRRLFSSTHRTATASASDSAAQVLGGLAVVF